MQTNNPAILAGIQKNGTAKDAKCAKEYGEELNHDDTAGTTEEKMKSVEPRMNADKRQ